MDDPEQELEREDLRAGLEVLAGLMACLAAMDERPDDYDAWLERTVNRDWDGVAEHWLAA